MSTMSSRSRFLAASAGIAVSAGLPVYISAQAALTPLKVAATPSDDCTPLIYGLKTGIFARNGIDLQITKMTSGAAVAAGVVSGAFDLGKSSVTTLFEAHEKGLPFTLIAPAVVYDPKVPYVAFLIPADVTITSPKDFGDKPIAISALGDIGMIAIRAWSEAHGFDPSGIKFVELPLSAAAAAVQEKRVSAAESSYPAMGIAVDTGKFKIFPAMDAVGTGWLSAAWFTLRDSSAKRPELYRNFAKAWATSAAYTNTHHAETVDMMAEFTGFSAAILAKVPRATLGLTLNAASIQMGIDASAKYGMVKKAFSAKEIIDPAVVGIL